LQSRITDDDGVGNEYLTLWEANDVHLENRSLHAVLV